MKNLAYFAAVALLCTGIAVAQSTSSANPNANSSTTTQQPSSNANTNAATPSSNASTTDQNNAGTAATTNETQTGQAKTGKRLPQTASPLALLSVLGMGLLGAGGVGRVRSFLKR